jgi:glycosyltransferase involved in cell wall biosynthesis
MGVFPTGFARTSKIVRMRHRVFFLLNQDPLDESAHALYCVRHVISLARNAPKDWSVVLVHASFSKERDILRVHDCDYVPNLTFRGLPSLRRVSGGCPLHINAIFHWAALAYLRATARSGDIVSTASFPEMFRFLAPHLLNARNRPRLVYEVHQLEMLTRDREHQKCRNEFEALGLADHLITTCLPLDKILADNFPSISRSNIGLAATYAPLSVTPSNSRFLRFGYFGSVSEEQGIPWLIENWHLIRQATGATHELHIYGRARRGEIAPVGESETGVYIHDPVPSQEVPSASRLLDALVIPSLDMAHRASIAFTKAYDYAGLALPIIASDLPTIREVLEPEKHALYFSPGSAEGLASAIRRLFEKPAIRETMTAALKERATFFSWKNRAGRWWDIFAR